MADDKVAGKNVLLLIDPAGGTSYKTVICLTQNSFSLENAIIDAKSKCGPDNLPGAQTVTVDFSGQIVLSAATGKLGLFDLLELAQAVTTIGWKIARATPVTGDVEIVGTGFLASIKADWQDENPSTFTGSLGIYGSPTITEHA